MTRETATKIVENWNGEDTRFILEGEIYTEDDVYQAQYILEQ